MQALPLDGDSIKDRKKLTGRGRGWPMGLRWSLASEATHSTSTYAYRSWLIARNCNLQCWLCRFEQLHGSGYSMVRFIKILGCPVIRISTRHYRCSTKERRAIHLALTWLHEILEESRCNVQPPQGHISGWLLPDDSQSLWGSHAGMHRRFAIRVFLLLDESHQTKAIGSELPVPRLHVLSFQISSRLKMFRKMPWSRTEKTLETLSAQFCLGTNGWRKKSRRKESIFCAKASFLRSVSHKKTRGPLRLTVQFHLKQYPVRSNT